jgi:hypothetical protein
MQTTLPTYTRATIRGMVALGAIAGLVLAATPVIADDQDPESSTTEEQGTEDGHETVEVTTEDARIECDAELIDDDNGDEPGYWVEPGQDLDCSAFGLDDAREAHWIVWFEGMHDDFEDEDMGTPVDGRFDFTVPIPNMPLWFEGLVFQLDDDEEPLVELHFWGSTDWDWLELSCEPNPVPHGGTVTCVAEEMLPDEEFWWWVGFENRRGWTIDDLEGDGVADEGGVGTFQFVVPDDDAIVAYWAVAMQIDSLATLASISHSAEGPWEVSGSAWLQRAREIAARGDLPEGVAVLEPGPAAHVRPRQRCDRLRQPRLCGLVTLADRFGTFGPGGQTTRRSLLKLGRRTAVQGTDRGQVFAGMRRLHRRDTTCRRLSFGDADPYDPARG